MTERVASPKEVLILLAVTAKDKTGLPMPVSGLIILQFLLARLLRGGQVTIVSETGFTVVKGEETASCTGDPAEIYLALVLMKFCQSVFGRELNLFAEGVNQELPGLLSRIERISIMLDQDHIASFDLPRGIDSLTKIVAAMALGNSHPETIEKLAAESLSELARLARTFVQSGRFHKPTMEITCLRDSVKK